MSLKDYRFDGEEKLELRGMNTGAKKDGVDKEDILRRTEKNLGASRRCRTSCMRMDGSPCSSFCRLWMPQARTALSSM